MDGNQPNQTPWKSAWILAASTALLSLGAAPAWAQTSTQLIEQSAIRYERMCSPVDPVAQCQCQARNIRSMGANDAQMAMLAFTAFIATNEADHKRLHANLLNKAKVLGYPDLDAINNSLERIDRIKDAGCNQLSGSESGTLPPVSEVVSWSVVKLD